MSWFCRIRRAAFVGVLLFFAVYLALFAFDAFQLTKAQAVVASLESVRLGAPLRQQQPRAKRFHENRCEGNVCYAEQDISNLPGGENFWRRSFSETPSLLPWKWWTVIAGIKLDTAGNVIRQSGFLYAPIHVYSIPALMPSKRDIREFRSGALR